MNGKVERKMKVEIYEHRSGKKIVPASILSELIRIFEEYEKKLQKCNAADVKEDIKTLLMQDGWSGEYRLDSDSKITITSFQKDTGLCFQTGNIGRIYADLLKLQTLYTKGNISAGVIIVPKKNMGEVFGSNFATYERVVRELPIFSQVITMPIVVIGFEEVED